MDTPYPFINLSTSVISGFSPEVREKLLFDHTTRNNIMWCTDNYAFLGAGFQARDSITVDNITSKYPNLILPRALKSKDTQRDRTRDMAEVFTPSWICNKQNNLIDSAWFGREDVFNIEIDNADIAHSWMPTSGKIEFPEGKTWQDYVTDIRLEITCGEAPYLVSRYDAVSGAPLPVEMRIGLLDRKLRVVGENTATSGQWLAAAKAALRAIYAYEWQGDNLLIARTNILHTILDFYRARFGRTIPARSLPGFAYIISWNIWQMDGLKGVIPDTCGERRAIIRTLFGETEIVKHCDGCNNCNIREHNGTYALIADWPADTASSQVKHKKTIRFIDLFK